jgi:hypothetical protein
MCQEYALLTRLLAAAIAVDLDPACAVEGFVIGKCCYDYAMKLATLWTTVDYDIQVLGWSKTKHLLTIKRLDNSPHLPR